MMMAGSSAAPDALPIWIPATFACAALTCLWLHWQFRSGAGWIRKTVGPSRASRGMQAVVLHMGLPCALASLGFALFAPFSFHDLPASLFVPYMIIGLLVIVAGGVWAWKEFERPTLSRTPTWLLEMMSTDEGLRDAVCRNRPLPQARNDHE